MRILMLNNEFPPLGGGTGTVNRALLLQFAQQRHLEIDLVTSALGRKPEQERFGDRVRIFKVPVDNKNIHHSSNRELLTYAARALPVAMRLHRTVRYDVCFAWSAVPAGGVALALRRLVRLPYIVRVCGPDIPGFERRYGVLYPILTPAIRAIWRGAAVVVAKCDGEANMIRAVDPGVAIALVPNGVDRMAFQPAAIPEAGALRLICVARLIERKGQRHLIEALRRVRAEGIPATLDLVGDGDAEQTYRGLVQAAGLATAVRFVGYVAREKIAAHYASAHAFVLPSYNEGMSVATLEAMAAGLPLIVTCTGGTAELVAEDVNGLTFDWADVDRLTAHLRRLATEPGLAQRMGLASRARAELFSWETAATRYMTMFDEIAARASTRLPKSEMVR